jgi:hypothetical protein
VTHKESIVSQFSPDIVPHLIEFGKYLSGLDVDVLLFMARKSLCVYDVVCHIGAPPSDRLVVSDRLLDMNLEPLAGKRIGLVDDTLILGSSLVRAKRKLESEAAASVTTHVFCLDVTWWKRNIIDPDFVALKLDDTAVMSFCAGEVRAMSLVPRPYIADFPFFDVLKIRNREVALFLSSADWTSFNISTDLQRRHDVSALTFFPTDRIREEFSTLLGPDMASCIEIQKVRAFARKNRDVHWVQLVPLVVLKSMETSTLDAFLSELLDRISTYTGADLGGSPFAHANKYFTSSLSTVHY